MDRTVDPGRPAKSRIDAAMEIIGDELCREDGRKNGYQERRLMTVIGEATFDIPRPRRQLFLDKLLCLYSMTDRAVVGTIAEAYKLVLPTGKTGRPDADPEFRRPNPSTVSKMNTTPGDNAV